MVKRHMKRLSMPKTIKIPKKAHTFVVRPLPGPHPKDRCIPLALLIRDYLKYALTLKEAKKIIHKGLIMVDGRIRKEPKYPIGLMDVVHILPTGEYYRILPKDGLLKPVKIPEKEGDLKICKIINKTTVKGGKIQLNLHDGRNILLEKNSYKTGDSLLLKLPSQEIVEVLPLEEGVTVLVTDGKHSGKIGKLLKIESSSAIRKSIVTFNVDNEELRTIKDYIMVVGTSEKSVISLGDVS